MKNCRVSMGIFFLLFFSNVLSAQTSCGNAGFIEESNAYDLGIDDTAKFIAKPSMFLDSTKHLVYEWFIHNADSQFKNVAGRDSILKYKFDTTGYLQIWLGVRDTVRNCGDTVYRGFSLYPSVKCRLNFTVKDTIDNCHYVFNIDSNAYTDSFEISFGDGKTFWGTNEQQILHKYKNDRYHSISIKAYGNNNTCLARSSKGIKVSSCYIPPTCKSRFYPYTFGGNPVNYRANLPIKFINSSIYDTTANARFEWRVDSQLVDTTFNLEHTFTKIDTYKLTLTVIDTAKNCRQVSSAQICVKPSGACRIRWRSVRDTIDKCTKVLELGNLPSSMDSFVVFNPLGDSTVHYDSSKMKFIFTYSRDGRYFPEVRTYGEAGQCIARDWGVVNVIGCDSTPLCTTSVSGRVRPDSAANANTVKFNFNPKYGLGVYTAWLIRKTGPLLKTVDSIQTDTAIRGGYFSFSNVCPDSYLVKVALDTNHIYYKDFIPTYFKSSLRWDSAQYIIVANSQNSYNNVLKMQSGINPGGPGFIAGKVKKGANKKAGEPIEGVEIILLNKADKPVAYTYSGKDGSFKIDNLAMGKYHLFAEVMGLEIDGLDVELDKTNPSIGGVEVEVGSKRVITSIPIQPAIASNPIAIYPNPANDFIHISIAQLKGQISLLDINGRLLKTIEIDSQTKLDVSDLQQGVYLLSFVAQNGQTFYKQVMLQ